MNTSMRRTPSFNIPGYAQNAVLQLIVASGSGFVMFHLIRVTLIVFGFNAGEAMTTLLPFVGLSPLHQFPTHFWTILTYGWIHNGFWEWVSDMVWLYCFGSALQMLVGYRHIVAVYFYGLIGGAAFCLLSQFIPGATFTTSYFIITGQAGVMALVAATITISPKYRFYLGENFSIPLLVVAGVYLVLTLATHPSPAMLALSAGGMFAGFLSMTALKRGIEPAGWVHRIYIALSGMIAPKEDLSRRADSRRNAVLNSLKRNSDPNPKHIDDILDKINQRGYNSLTKEERDLLVQASKDVK